MPGTCRWQAPAITGSGTALADTESNPFARADNVTFPSGQWSRDIRHGEMIRSGTDQLREINPCLLRWARRTSTTGRDAGNRIGVKRDNGRNRVVVVTGLTMDSKWNTTGTGTEVASAALSGSKVWLRANADIRPGSGRQARFSYSTDGVTFTSLGSGFTLNNAWQFFMGYRFGVFNHATQALGGAVTLQRFDLTTP